MRPGKRRRGNRRLQSRHYVAQVRRARTRDDLQQSRMGIFPETRVRPRHRRLQSSDQARSEICVRLQQPRRRLARKGDSTAPSPTTPKRSGSSRNSPSPTTYRGLAWYDKSDYDRAIADYDGRSSSIPRYAHRLQQPRLPTTTRATDDRAIADYDRAIGLNPELPVAYFNRGDRLCRDKATTTAPSPTTTRRSDRPRKRCRVAFNDRGRAYAAARAITTAPSPTTARRSGSIPRIASATSTAASPRQQGRATTAPSPTTARRSGSIRKTPALHYNRGNAYGAQGRHTTSASPTTARRSARSERRRVIPQPRHRLVATEELRPRHRRLQRGDRLDPNDAIAYYQPRPCLARQERVRPRHRRLSTRRSASIRSTPSPTTTAASPGATRATYDRAIADFDEAIRLDPKYAVAYDNRGRRLARQGRLRPRHRRLRPRRSGSIRNTPAPTTTAASPTAPRATTTAPSPTSPRRSGSIRSTPSPTTTAASPGRQERLRPRHRRLHEAIRLDPQQGAQPAGAIPPNDRHDQVARAGHPPVPRPIDAGCRARCGRRSRPERRRTDRSARPISTAVRGCCGMATSGRRRGCSGWRRPIARAASSQRGRGQRRASGARREAVGIVHPRIRCNPSGNADGAVDVMGQGVNQEDTHDVPE